MPTKKQTKKITKKTATKRTTTKATHTQQPQKTSRLKTWLFDKPVIFALLTFLINCVIVIVYAMIANIFAITAVWPLVLLLIASFCWTTYYLIKKLPHNNMYRDDFVAITNGCCLISVLIPAIVMLLFGNDIQLIKYKFVIVYFWHPVLALLLIVFFALLYLYLLGVAISGFYAKYKRARELGISKWRIILSVPYAFLLMWAPGYLLSEKKKESNLTIKSKWFAKLNKWIVSSTTNTLLAFLTLVLIIGQIDIITYRNAFAGLSALLLTLFLLMIYTLWILKHKTSFLKNINNGYAWTAVAINITIIIMVILGIIALGATPY